MFIVENLKQDAEYVIRVAAMTDSGSGKMILVFCTIKLYITIDNMI